MLLLPQKKKSMRDNTNEEYKGKDTALRSEKD